MKFASVLVVAVIVDSPSPVTSSSVAACTAATADIEAALRSRHEYERNVGLSAAVLHRGVMAYSGAIGLSDLEHRVPATTHTRFKVASINKAFTGLALLLMADKGLIDLDAPVQRYVPTFKPPQYGELVTPRLLAGHFGGVRHYRSDRTAERTPTFFATHYNRALDAVGIFATDSLVAKPGERQVYSSYGYNLLAAAIESAAGKPFREVLQELVLDPAGLKETALDDIRMVIPNRSRHYAMLDAWTYEATPEMRRVPEFDYSYNSGGGNLITTAEDLVKFGAAVSKPGVFSAQTLALLREQLRFGNQTSTWSYGWFATPDSAGRRKIHINGGQPGVQSALYVYPDEEIAVAIITNTWGIDARAAVMATSLPQHIAQLCRAQAKS